MMETGAKYRMQKIRNGLKARIKWLVARMNFLF